MNAPDTGATLHVAALPFPTHQGTQAALRHMLEALAARGRDARLLTYAHAGHDEALAFQVERSVELLRHRSQRSGPSAHKLLADAALALALSRLLRRSDPALLIAHHVEAAAIAAALPARAGRPLVFFAHTDLAAELPAYAPPPFARALGHAGGQLDALLVRRADAVAAVSPLLAARLRARAGAGAEHVKYVPLPWSLPAPISEPERAQSRLALGISAGARVLLYAGNLDRYQGWEELLAALPALRAREPELSLLVATQSDPAPLLHAARRAGVAGLVRVQALDGEPQRRRLHAAADLAVVPRRAPGGLPIKLLDAMARGVPCVAAQTARAGLPIERAVELAGGDDAAAIAAAVARALARPQHARRELAARARAYVGEHHGAPAFLRAFDAVCTRARQRAAQRRLRLAAQS